MKNPICKHCLKEGHYQTFCPNKPRKPIKSKVEVMSWEKYQQKKGNKPVKPNKKINPISDKEKKRLAEYRIVRDKFLKENPICEFPNCSNKEVQLHHGKGRIGSLLSDVRHFHSLCDTHHRWVEENPLKAKEMGLSANRLDK